MGTFAIDFFSRHEVYFGQHNDRGYNIKISANGIGLSNYYVSWMKLNNDNKALNKTVN
jgi:hypothetical protein